MKVVELRARSGLDGLVVSEREPVKPGPSQLLVKVQAVSLNYRDLAIVNGHYGNFELPIIPTSDAAGTVVEVGADVTRFAVGDSVCPHYVIDWVDGPPRPEVVARRLGGPQDGVLAEYVVVDEAATVRAPRHLSAHGAATLPIAGVTAWQALFVKGRVKPGDVVLVQGTGGVSTFALQLAHIAGARVIATSGSDEKAARASQLGASDTINYRSVRNWPERVMELTGGRGADHVIDVVGGDNLARSVQATRIGGCISLIGFLADTRGVIDLPELFRRVITLHAISVGSRVAFEQLVAAVEATHMQPVVGNVFKFDAFRDAFACLEAGNHVGKVVITLAD